MHCGSYVQIYEYTPPPPINALVTPLDGNGFKNFISNKKLLSLVKTTLSIILDNESNNEIGL
jgi:hypothetical protein